MTETIIIIRNLISAQDVVDVFLDDVKAEAVLTYLVDKEGNRHPFEGCAIQIDIINPKDMAPPAARSTAAQPERMVSEERKAELDDAVGQEESTAAEAGTGEESGTTDAEAERAGEDAAHDNDEAPENSHSTPAGKRYFYNADTDKLIVTEDGSEPDEMHDEETAGDWSEVDASEGEEIEAELAKQGDLLGGGEGPHAEKSTGNPQEDRQEKKGVDRPDEGSTPKGGKLAQMAGILCNEGAFWKYLSEAGGAEIDNAEAAADAIRNICGVTSRAELDSDKKAGHEFKMMERSYRAWFNT